MVWMQNMALNFLFLTLKSFMWCQRCTWLVLPKYLNLSQLKSCNFQGKARRLRFSGGEIPGMCMKRAVNHGGRRGGKEQQAPVDIQCLRQCWCGVIRCLWVESLEEGSGLGQRMAFPQRSPAFLPSKLNSTDCVVSVWWGRCVVSSKKECSVKCCCPSVLGFCPFLHSTPVLHS